MNEPTVTITYATVTTRGVMVSVPAPNLPKVIDLPEVVDWLHAQGVERVFYPGNSQSCVVGCYVRERFNLTAGVTTGHDETVITVGESYWHIRHTRRLHAFISAFDAFIPPRVVCGWYCTTRDEALDLAEQVMADDALPYDVTVAGRTLTVSDVALAPSGGDLVLELPQKRKAQEMVPA